MHRLAINVPSIACVLDSQSIFVYNLDLSNFLLESGLIFICLSTVGLLQDVSALITYIRIISTLGAIVIPLHISSMNYGCGKFHAEYSSNTEYNLTSTKIIYILESEGFYSLKKVKNC